MNRLGQFRCVWARAHAIARLCCQGLSVLHYSHNLKKHLANREPFVIVCTVVNLCKGHKQKR